MPQYRDAQSSANLPEEVRQFLQSTSYQEEPEPEEQEDAQQPSPDEERKETIHVYPVEGGGILFTREPLEEADTEEPVRGSQDPDTRPKSRYTPPYFLSFLFLLGVFLLLDVADNQLLALMAPTATIAITPRIQSVTLQSSFPLGKVLSPLTLTESQTVATTGHGHQDARAAAGTLTFYNGSNTARSVSAGTVFTGSDGMRVATATAVTIPAAIAPQFGEATIPAQAQDVGTRGNIQADDLNLAVSSDLTVKNLAPFTGGQDARDFNIVTQADRDTTAAILLTKVAASMSAALQQQTPPDERLHISPCSPTVSASNAPGEEATQLTVTVSETCTAIAYDPQQLTAQATQVLTTQAMRKFGQGYLLRGEVRVTVTKAAASHKTVVLSFTCQGTYIYQFNAKGRQRIISLVAGKPRLTALHQLATLPGIQRASISGISDNQPIPDDLTHIHLLLIVEW